MELKYKSEILEDQLYKEFYQDTKEHWSQREQPDIRDFIKWAIIKGYLKNSEYMKIREQYLKNSKGI